MTEQVIAFRIDVKGTKSQADEINRVEVELKKLRSAKSKYQKLQAQGIPLDQKATKRMAELTEQISLNTVKRNKLKRSLDLSSKSQLAASGSLEKLRVRTSQLRAENEKIAIGTTKWKKNAAEIKRNQTQILKLEATTKRYYGNVGNYAGGIKSAFKSIGLAVVGVMATIRSINYLIGGSLKAFDKEAKAVSKVTQAIKSTAGSARLSLHELRVEASRLQNETIFGNEEILNGATAQLLTFTNIAGSNFKRTQAVALDLATVLDGDLKSTSIQLGKALNDPVKNLSALSRAGIQFSKDQTETIKTLAETNRLAEAQEVILVELERQYGGQAKAAVVGVGAFTQLGNTIGDLREEMGEALSKGLSPMIKGLNELLSTTPDIVGALRAEQSAIESQIQAITSLNEGNELRTELLTDLNREYPDLLSNIDTETVTNATLLEILKNVNAEYQNRIAIAVIEEEIAEVNKENMEYYRQQREALDVINRIYQTHVRDRKEGATLEEKIAAIREGNLAVIGSEFVDQATVVKGLQGQAEEYLQVFNDLGIQRNELQERYNELFNEQIGYQSKLPPPSTPDPVTVPIKVVPDMTEEEEFWAYMDTFSQDLAKETKEAREQSDREYAASHTEFIDGLMDDDYKRNIQAIKLDKDRTDLQDQQSKASLGTAQKTLSGIKSLTKEGSKAQKAASISEGLVNTYAAATAAYKSLAGIPIVGPALAAVAAGVAVALGLKNVASMKAVKAAKGKVPGGDPGPTTPISSVVGNDGQGMIVPGSGSWNSDNILTLISPKEAVLNARSMASTDHLSISGTPRQIATELNAYKGYGRRFATGYVPSSPGSLRGVIDTPDMERYTEMIIDKVVDGVKRIPVVNDVHQLDEDLEFSRAVKNAGDA